MIQLDSRTIAAFWERVDTTGGCWEWRGNRQLGYGRIKVNGRMLRAHRIAYELLVGPIPEGLTLDHLCRNKGCVNPAHLEPVTFEENVRRGESFSTINRRRTHCPQGHPYSGDNLSLSERGFRRCKICAREKTRRYRIRQGLIAEPA